MRIGRPWTTILVVGRMRQVQAMQQRLARQGLQRFVQDTIAPLTQAGCRVYVPYLRGYGPTRFLSSATPRSGEQAACCASTALVP